MISGPLELEAFVNGSSGLVFEKGSLFVSDSETKADHQHHMAPGLPLGATLPRIDCVKGAAAPGTMT